MHCSDCKTEERTVSYEGKPSPVSIRMRRFPVPIRYVFVPGHVSEAEGGI